VSPVPKAPASGSQVGLAPAPHPDKSDEPNPFIRLRHPDGTTEVVEETDEMRQRRFDEMEEAEALHGRETAQLKAEFTKALSEKGAQAAIQVLAPYLRNPKRSVADEARVCEALRLSAEIQKDLGQRLGSSPYESARGGATSLLTSFLTDGETNTAYKQLALSYLCGRPVAFHVQGVSSREVQGLQTFDLAETPQVLAIPGPATDATLRTWAAGANPMLRNPAVADACWQMARDANAPDYLRAEAIRALGTRSEAVEQLDLAAAMSDPGKAVREAVVDLLASRPGGTPPATFFSLIGSERDPETKKILFERLSGPAFSRPEMLDVLNQSLPVQPREDDRNYSDALFRQTVLRLTLEEYGGQQNGPILGLLTQRLADWSRIEWLAVDSPVVALAEQAAKKGWKEFASPLASVVDALPSAKDQEKVRAALARLGP
jgi:hypothetical protein